MTFAVGRNIFSKVLVKINLDKAQEGYDITFEGAKPKLCTGYRNQHGMVAIPIRELIKQSVSLHNESLDWFSTGDVTCEDRPCKFFHPDELEFLCN